MGEYEVRASNWAVRWETDGPEKYGSYGEEGQRRNGEVAVREWKPRISCFEVKVLKCWRCLNCGNSITHVFPRRHFALSHAVEPHLSVRLERNEEV